MKTLVLVLAFGLALAGCKTLPPVTVVGCPYIVAHDKEFQARVADAYANATPEMRAVAKEWLSLRDQARACRAASRL